MQKIPTSSTMDQSDEFDEKYPDAKIFDRTEISSPLKYIDNQHDGFETIELQAMDDPFNDPWLPFPQENETKPRGHDEPQLPHPESESLMTRIKATQKHRSFSADFGSWNLDERFFEASQNLGSHSEGIDPFKSFNEFSSDDQSWWWDESATQLTRVNSWDSVRYGHYIPCLCSFGRKRASSDLRETHRKMSETISNEAEMFTEVHSSSPDPETKTLNKNEEAPIEIYSSCYNDERRNLFRRYPDIGSHTTCYHDYDCRHGYTPKHAPPDNLFYGDSILSDDDLTTSFAYHEFYDDYSESDEFKSSQEINHPVPIGRPIHVTERNSDNGRSGAYFHSGYESRDVYIDADVNNYPSDNGVRNFFRNEFEKKRQHDQRQERVFRWLSKNRNRPWSSSEDEQESE